VGDLRGGERVHVRQAKGNNYGKVIVMQR
jgi:hypothetical protein